MKAGTATWLTIKLSKDSGLDFKSFAESANLLCLI
jgi:hypothetical protein